MKKIGVLLVNLGTPDAPNTKAVRKYLAEFLSDPRVIEIPKILWQIILRGIILNTRPQKSAQKYQTVWTEEGSPLLAISHKQAQLLSQALPDYYTIEVAMRYGNPSIEKGINALLDQKVDKIVVFPLYPQYCAATTATVFDKVAEVLMKKRFIPALEFLGDYHKNPLYIEACAEYLRDELQKKTYDKILFSYHGMPQRTYDLGDPYYDQCVKTSELIAKKMNLNSDQYMTVFQSRFGKAKWLKPYAAQTLAELPQSGTKSVAVFCPGFSADCLETIEEMGDENKKVFIDAGGKEYHFIACLNDKAKHIEALKSCLISSTQ